MHASRQVPTRASLVPWVLIGLLLAVAIPASAQPYAVDWYTTDGGGSTSAGVGFAVSGTIGQPDASPALTGGAYSVIGGFWGVALPQPTTTTVGSSLNPSAFVQSVTFTATLSPSIASGSVTFKDGVGTLGTVTLNGSGQASLTTSSLAVGTHSITAEYAGNGTFLPSSSGVLSQVVKGTLTVSKSGSGSGTVTSGGGEINCGVSCSAAFSPNSPVTLTATPATGSTFTGWSGSCTGTGTCQLTMDASKAVTATFALNGYTLTVSKTGDGFGTVTSTPAGVNCGSTCAAAFNFGTLVTLNPTPAASSTFGGWGGACSGAGSCQVTMNAAAGVTASFFCAPNGANDSDSDGMPDNVELSEGRAPCVKDNDVFTNARWFAMQQYRDFLKREGDPGGISYWTSTINAGMARAVVTKSFFDSPEFQGAIAPVARLYFAYFNRIPDLGGLEYWIANYGAGMSLNQISQVFAGSPEFQETYGSLSNAQFVTLVYQNVLGRAPDAFGLAYWTWRLDTNAETRGQVMVGFSESPEYQQTSYNRVFVTMVYYGMLHRVPEQLGFDYWVAQLNAGASALDLINGFLVAPEYHGRFLP